MPDELCFLPATEALTRFRDRSLSPVELLEAVIGQAERVEPVVNALCHTFHEEALEQARAAEARYTPGASAAPRALEGIPLALKEEEALAGQPLTGGSLIHRDEIATSTSPFAQRMLDAGAIVHARSTAPEFSVAGFTSSRLWGVTRNPWNPAFSPGGSSGGSGAALASGTATLASGSDIGGSIRIPASFCGVVGFKPPYGRVPVEPPYNLDTYCHCGPMARTVADCAAYENAIAGPEPGDITTLRPAYVLPARFEGVAGLRVALSADLGDWPVDPDVRANTLDAAEALRAAGAIVEEVDLRVPRAETLRAAAVHFQSIFGAWVAGMCRTHPDEVTAYAAFFEQWCEETAAGLTILEGLELEAQLYAPVGALLERHDALLTTTNGTRGLDAGDDYTETRLTVDGQEVGYYEEGLMTVPFNVMSRCPVLNVPSGLAGNGVPTGVQLVGRTYDDLTVFRLGAALERERPWLDVPERRPALARAR